MAAPGEARFTPHPEAIRLWDYFPLLNPKLTTWSPVPGTDRFTPSIRPRIIPIEGQLFHPSLYVEREGDPGTEHLRLRLSGVEPGHLEGLFGDVDKGEGLLAQIIIGGEEFSAPFRVLGSRRLFAGAMVYTIGVEEFTRNGQESEKVNIPYPTNPIDTNNYMGLIRPVKA